MTFTPPTEDSVPRTNAPNSPEWRQNPLGNKLMRHFAPGVFRGRNVFLLTDGTVIEELPAATYHADGTPDQSAWDQVAKVFWGGHFGEDVTAEEQAALEGAGYVVA